MTTNVYCRILCRTSSTDQAYWQFPCYEPEHTLLIGEMAAYDFRPPNFNCEFEGRTIELNNFDLMISRCPQCAERNILGFAGDNKWRERSDGTGAFFERQCTACGALIVRSVNYTVLSEVGS